MLKPSMQPSMTPSSPLTQSEIFSEADPNLNASHLLLQCVYGACFD
jgi:hypothetical protein